MGTAKLVCGCAALLIGAGQFASLPPQKREALVSTARLLIGGEPQPKPAPESFSTPALPTTSVSTTMGSQTEIIAPDRFGQYQTTIEVEGQRLPALVDTGATFVVLNFEDAARLGLRPMPSDFKYKTWTANGEALNAMVELRDVRLGSIEVRDVPVLIAARGSLAQNLLGMSFLTKLSGLRVDGKQLILHQ